METSLQSCCGSFRELENGQVASTVAKSRNCCKELDFFLFFVFSPMFFRFCFRFLSVFPFLNQIWQNQKNAQTSSFFFLFYFRFICVFFSVLFSMFFLQLFSSRKNMFDLFSVYFRIARASFNLFSNYFRMRKNRIVSKPEAFVLAITSAIATVIFATLAGFVATS